MTQSAIANVVSDSIPPLPPTPAPSVAETESRRRAGWRLIMISAVAVVGLAGAMAAGTLPRVAQQQQLTAGAKRTAAQRPQVTVAVAQRMAPTAERVLPGNSMPLVEAALYARVTGYVSQRLVDIGDRVEAGQVLSVIDAPDIDDQLAQAKANLEQARANLNKAQADDVFAASQEQRYRSLVQTRAVSSRGVRK